MPSSRIRRQRTSQGYDKGSQQKDISIKYTGRARLAQLLYKKRKNQPQFYRIHERQNDDHKDDSKPKQQKSKDDGGKDDGTIGTISSDNENPIIFSSYDYHLLSKQKQVGYVKDCSSPIKSMKIFSFDSYPVHLDGDQCLFEVEASTVQYIDCAIRRNECDDLNIDSPDVPGFCAVGRIIAVASDNDRLLKVGERIATILQKGGNSRFCCQSSSKLIKISDSDNAKDICGLLSTYMAAFACLRHTVPEGQRYLLNSLSDQIIFVNGGMSAVGQAIIHLSRKLGAKKVYATGKPKDFGHLKKLGASPLHLDLLTSSTGVGTDGNNIGLEKKIDIVIDCTSFDIMESLLNMKKEDGRLVYYKYGDISSTGRHGWRGNMAILLLKFKLMTTFQNASFCDPVQDVFLDKFDIFQNDFRFLQEMTRRHPNKSRLLIPRVVATISLEEVPYTHFKLEMNNVKGIITVDPWE